MKRKGVPRASIFTSPQIRVILIGITLLLCAIVSSGVSLVPKDTVAVVEAQTGDALPPPFDTSLCEFTKPMGQYTLCIVYEEEAGSLQDIIEWNPSTESMYIIGAQGQICFWDRLIGNTPANDVYAVEDTTYPVSGYERWAVKVDRGTFMPDVEHLIVWPSSGTGPCLPDQ